MKLTYLITTLILLFAGAAAQSADIEAGRAKSVTCIACHGKEGISPSPMWPNLAGQKEQYLKTQIIAFRDGSRKSAQMASMVAKLSDEDAAHLAAYYANLGK